MISLVEMACASFKCVSVYTHALTYVIRSLPCAAAHEMNHSVRLLLKIIINTYKKYTYNINLFIIL